MVEIRRADPADAGRLTAIAHAAKRHWGYPEELISSWREELTVSPGEVAARPVFRALQGSEIVGFYALLERAETCELDHLWVEPGHIGEGIGSRLFEHAAATAAALGARALRIASDPNAEGFYRRMGARRVGEAASRPAGRTLPLLELALDTAASGP